MEEQVTRYIMRRIDGIYINFKYEPVKSIREAARFYDVEHFNSWINGHYKPAKPENYEVVPMEIMYKVVEIDVQEV